MACTETYTHFGTILTCDIDGGHEILMFPDANTMHSAIWVNLEGVHPGDDAPIPCGCLRNPECRGTVGPLYVRVGWGIPVEEEDPA